MPLIRKDHIYNKQSLLNRCLFWDEGHFLLSVEVRVYKHGLKTVFCISKYNMVAYIPKGDFENGWQLRCGEFGESKHYYI